MKKILFQLFICLSLTQASPDGDELARAIFSLANQTRQNNDLYPLLWDERLATVAKAHSRDMMDRNFQDHINPDGEGPDERLRRIYPELLCNIGENIYGVEVQNGTLDAIPQLADEAVAGWLRSPKHRENLLNPNWTHMSIGVEVRGESYYATQLFTEEFLVLDKPLPKTQQTGSHLTVTGQLTGRWRMDRLEVYLILPNPQAVVKISESRALLGIIPLKVDSQGRNFSTEVDFDIGKGIYAIGFGQSGESYFPFGRIEVK